MALKRSFSISRATARTRQRNDDGRGTARAGARLGGQNRGHSAAPSLSSENLLATDFGADVLAHGADDLVGAGLDIPAHQQFIDRQASGVLLAGVILWGVLFRGQLGLSLVFLEEM